MEGRVNEAEQALNKFERDFPSEKSKVKDLRRKLFTLGNETKQTQNIQPRNPVGFNSTQTTGGKETDDFFKSQPRKIKIKETTKKKSSKTNNEDDFFSTSNSKPPSIKDGNSKITNNDFNF